MAGANESPSSSKNDELRATVPEILATKQLTEEEVLEKRSILKNVVVVSFAFTLQFTSYNSMENMQSSLNNDDGTTSLAALYAGFLFSGCFLPSLLLKHLKEKYTLALSAFSFSVYMAAQFYPKIYLLVPTAVVLGLGAASLWASKGTYITKSGKRYAEITGEDTCAVITRFFSIFYMFYQSTQVWGNLLSSAVLSIDAVVEFNKSEDALDLCGYNFCVSRRDSYNESFTVGNGTQEVPARTSDKPAHWQIYVLATVYVAGPILASLLILIFLDPIKGSGDSSRSEDDALEGKSGCQLIAATLNHLRHPYQLLLIPLTIWSGVERAFLGADFTAAYVSCSLGIHMVGFIMICYGAFDVLASMSASTMVKFLGRVPVIIMAFLINLSLIVTLIYWIPNPQQMPVFFAISGLWGFADGIWQTQINSLYGVLFAGNTEAGFSNCRLWEATGFTIAFACSSVLCISSKIVVIITFLVLGVTGYLIIETIERLGGLKRRDD